MSDDPIITRQALLELLPAFAELYAARPIAVNDGGMHFNHAFAAFALARHLAPPVIIESGVWKGQSTWLFEQACPQNALCGTSRSFTRTTRARPCCGGPIALTARRWN